MNAQEYCRQSAEELFQQQAEQEDDNFWQKPETQALLDKRKIYIKRVLVQLMKAQLPSLCRFLIPWQDVTSAMGFSTKLAKPPADEQETEKFPEMKIQTGSLFRCS